MSELDELGLSLEQKMLVKQVFMHVVDKEVSDIKTITRIRRKFSEL